MADDGCTWPNNSPGKDISKLCRVAALHESRDGEWLLPEQVDHVFKIVDPLCRACFKDTHGYASRRTLLDASRP
jgi:hypothetical protein